MPLSVVVPGAKIWSIELSLFPSRSPKVTRIHKWDQEFESARRAMRLPETDPLNTRSGTATPAKLPSPPSRRVS
jgi:hypothetical protein